MRVCNRCGAPLKNGKCEYCETPQNDGTIISQNGLYIQLMQMSERFLWLEKRLTRRMILLLAISSLVVSGLVMAVIGAYVSNFAVESVEVEYEIEQMDEITGGVE